LPTHLLHKFEKKTLWLCLNISEKFSFKFGEFGPTFAQKSFVRVALVFWGSPSGKKLSPKKKVLKNKVKKSGLPK
jgi:hypothetical protein